MAHDVLKVLPLSVFMSNGKVLNIFLKEHSL